MDDRRVTFLRIEREQRAGNGGRRADDDPTISFQYKDVIVKMNVSSYSKVFVDTALKFMFENEDGYADVLERSCALSKANARSIADDLMDTIRNDVPERSRLCVSLKTLFDDPPTGTPAAMNATSRVQSGPAKDGAPPRARRDVRRPPPLPKTPPYNNLPTWKNVPTAPTLDVRRTDDGRLEMAWTMRMMHKSEPIRYYELYYCRETDETWTKCAEIIVISPPMICTLQGFGDGHAYYFALRAVDVRDRRAPFATTRITPRD